MNFKYSDILPLKRENFQPFSLTQFPNHRILLRPAMMGYREAFGLSKDEVRRAEPPGTSKLIGLLPHAAFYQRQSPANRCQIMFLREPILALLLGSTTS